MPFRSPANAPPSPVAELTPEVALTALYELLSDDAATQRLAVQRFLARDCTFVSHLAKAEGRWEVWQCLHAVVSLFCMHIEPISTCIDKSGTVAMIYFTELFKPRVPLVQWLLPQYRTPVVMHMRFAEQSPELGGGLMIQELVELHSTMELPSVFFGPLGVWALNNVVQPGGRMLLQTVSDTTHFLKAVNVFVRKQFLGQSGAGAQPPAGPPAHTVPVKG